MDARRPAVLLGTALAATALAACTGGGGDRAVATAAREGAATEEAAPSVPPPSAFAAQPGAFRVVLTWAPPAEEVERYVLYRDGFALMAVPGSESTFTDEEVLPGERHTYQIESRLDDGASERMLASVETVVPPLRAARVAGAFEVATRVARRSGYSTYRRPRFAWAFSPRCREGPCAVRWRELGAHGVRMTLARDGARYRGTYTGPFINECAGSPSTSTVRLDLRVAAARAIGGEWRATRLVGTLDHSETAQLGCVASTARLQVRARLDR